MLHSNNNKSAIAANENVKGAAAASQRSSPCKEKLAENASAAEFITSVEVGERQQ